MKYHRRLFYVKQKKELRRNDIEQYLLDKLLSDELQVITSTINKYEKIKPKFSERTIDL